MKVSQIIQRGKSPTYSLIRKVPVVAQKCIQKDGILSLNKALFIEPSFINKYNDNKLVKENDILMNSTGTGTVGRVSIVERNLFEKYQTIVTDSHVTTIRTFEKLISPHYVLFFLKSPIIFDNVEKISEGSTNQIELYAKTIMNYCIPLPPLNEQIRIVKKITKIFKSM